MKQMSGGSSIRRMGMKNRLKKIAVIGLSACLALGMLSGCSKKETFQADAAAITVNGDEISAGLVKFATHYSQALMESMYKMYMGVEDPMDSDIYGNGSTLGSMIKDDVVSTLERLVLAEQKMSDYNVELTDDEKAAVTEAATRFMDENGEEVLNQMGATQEVVERYLTLRLIQSKMEPQMSADVDTEVSDDEAAQRKIRYTLFRAETEAETESETGTEAESSSESEATTEAVSEAGTEGETSVETEAETAAMTEEQTVKTKSSAETETETASEAASEPAETETGSEAATEASESETETETETEDPAMVAAKAEALAKAEDLIAKVKDGEDFETASAEVDEDATCSTLTFGSDSTSVVEGLITATEGLDDGTLVETPIEIDSGYYVAQVISKLDREATDKQKETIIKQRKSDRISELYTEWKDAAEITEDSDILAQITFDFSLTQETEASTEATTEATTEAGSESATEAVTEAVSEATTEAGSEVTTEAATEAAETESESESETADKTESESETAAAK